MRSDPSLLTKIKKFELSNLLERLKNNLWAFISIFITLIIFLIFDISFAFIAAFYLAFYWNWILSLVSIRRRAKLRKYAFSFIKLTLIINRIFEKLIRKQFKGRKKFIRALSPFSFFLLILIATGDNYLISSILGSITFEVSRRVNELIIKP